MEFTIETLWVLLAAIVCYLALWCYFDACRQRDAYQTGRGAGDLPPNTWAALVFFFAPIAGPLYLKARDRVVLEANPRTGAPPVFESRGLNVYGWLGLLLFLGGGGYLVSEKEYLLAGLAFVMAGIAVFGGRKIVATDRALKVELPESAAWEQVGFRPLPREDEPAEDDEEELVVNLDRLPPPPARPAGAPGAPPTYGSPAAPAYRSPAATTYESPPAPAYGSPPTPSYGSPAAPTYGSPAAPAHGSPPAPTYGSPAAPTYGSPPAPAYGSPARPAYGSPAAPAFASPAAPAYGSPTAPASPPQGAAAPPATPARPPAATSVRISDILWAASEDDFDDGSSGAPATPGAPRSLKATADPALFQQLGGIFAPPGATPARPALPPTAGRPAPPPSAASPAASANMPAFAPPPAAPVLHPPLQPPEPAAARPREGAPGAPRRSGPPVGGGYAAASKSAESPLPRILIAVFAVLLLAAGVLWLLSRRAAAPETATPGTAAPETGGPPAEVPAPTPAAETPAAETPAEGGQPSESGPVADPQEVEHAAGQTWMGRYLELYGPVGQSAEEIDFEGFAPERCARLRDHTERATVLEPLPDQQLQFQFSSCIIALSYLPLDCENRDTASWCGHLLEARRCLSDVQLGIEARWGLPGLLEFQISDTEPRSTDSMTGRCIEQELAERARAVQP